MRKLLFIITIFSCLQSKAQLIADPTIEQVSFTDLTGNAIDDTMPLGYIAQLNIPIRNSNITNGIPSGSCKIKIGLGTKIILDPAFNISLASTNDYFDWSASFTGGQVQITGELRVPLPANYSGIARFNVMGNILDYSTITTNFLITNHNTQVILSDEDPSNNSSFRLYKIVALNPIPVHFNSFSVSTKECTAAIIFKTENEINTKQYDIEISDNGSTFKKSGNIVATNAGTYTYQTALTGRKEMYIRIKSIDNDGRYQYSDVKKINGICDVQLKLSLYPNPVVANSEITIRAIEGLLNGQYEITLYDMSGRKISSKQFLITNGVQLIYRLANEPDGQYTLTVLNRDNNTKAGVFTIQKR